MSSSNSSSPKPDQKLKNIVVDSEEKRTRNHPKQESPQEVVSERTIIERPRFGLGVVQAEKDMMKKHSMSDNIVHSKRGFSSSNALCFHRNTHKHGQVLEMRKKKMDPRVWMKPYNSYQGGSSSNNSTYPPFSSGVTSMDMTVGHPVTPYRSFLGNTSYDVSSRSPLLSQKYNNHTLWNIHRQGLSLGPFKSRGRGRGSSSRISIAPSLFDGVTRGTSDMNMAMVPPSIPYRSFTESTRYSSFSRDHLRSYNNRPHGLSLELSLGPSNPIGSNNNNNSSHALSNGNHLELSLSRRSKSIESSRRLKALHARLHKHKLMRSLINRNVPPSPTTNLSNDENVLGSSSSENLISKGKNKIVVLEDDDKDKEVIEDHDEDQPDQEAEAKSWGRDLSLSF